jgi:threonine/homoserine/homoserine lactone efflux protein
MYAWALSGSSMEPAAFAIACFPLLAAPGPTNTLLATSGAAIGVRGSLPLLAAELSGYLLAIFLLRVLVGPLIAAVPAFGIALRIAAVIYLLHLAAKLCNILDANLSRHRDRSPSLAYS